MRIVYSALTKHRHRRASLFLALALTASLALALDPHRDLRQYGHRSWQTDDGLPQNTVHAVIQSRDGYIWLGTEGGLVRFDGAEFVVYDKEAPAHLPSGSINSLFEDRSGDLWIGAEGGLVRRHGAEFSTFSTASGLPSNTIWSILETTDPADSAVTLWVVTSAGLARYRKDHFEAIAIPEGITSPASIAPAPDGSLWIGTPNGVIHCLDGVVEPARLLSGIAVQTIAVTRDGAIWAGTRTGLYRDAPGKHDSPTPLALSGLPANEVTALTVAGNGSLWVGTSRGIRVYDPAGGPIRSFTGADGLPADRVESISQDREGALWIATARGPARIVEGRVQTFAAGDGLFGNVVLSMLEDREGSLWLGTESGGLEMLHDQKFTAYTTAEGLSDNLTRSVFQARDGGVWVGTSGGGLNHFEHGAFTSLTTANGLSSNIVLALGEDALGDLWVGTPDGLNRIQKGNRITVFTSADGLADDFVRSLHAAPDGSMWIGTRRGLSHLEHGHFTNYSSLDGLGSDLVGAMIEDTPGASHSALWIGTLGGLSRFDHNKFTTLTTRDGLTSNVITALYRDADDTLWIGTNQGGLNRLRNGKITAYLPAQTHLPESVYAILEDARGNLWLSSRTGIYSVAKQELNAFADRASSSIMPNVYGTADGMKIGEGSSGGHPAAWRLRDGTMWFATLRGIAAVNPEDLTENTVPPPVAIEQVLIDDQPVDATGAFTVPAGRGRFEFHYAALSFIAPQKIRFRYKLEGLDRDWVDAGPRRAAYYTNLPPAKYRFRVLACNNDGVWNETGAFVDFRLQPHYYQTLWFYLVLVLGLTLLAWQIYRWRLRQLELRYDAVLSERGRIAREIHDTLAQGLVGISVQLEVVNRLLASSVESARAQLDHARNLVRGSLTEARSSIWDLRSQAAETEDLVTRLARMAEAATETSTPKIRVKSKVSGIYRPLSPRAEGELLKIAQEAVINAVRHAAPSQISIEMRFSARELQMTVEDNGRGFDGQPHPHSAGPDGHFGLTGMRERAAQIGGTLSVDSAPGKGTRVSIHVGIDV